MQLKVLTANIAFGLDRMDNVLVNITGHLAFHGGAMVTWLFNPKALKNRVGYANPKRVRYLERHSNLQRVVSLVASENADVVMLNEVILQLHREALEKSLRDLGYASFSWGRSAHYPDTTVSSLIVAKVPAEPATVPFPQESHPCGGGGIAILRLRERRVTLAVVHMSLPGECPWLYDAEMKAVTDFIEEEKSRGREVVIGGDWNAPSSFIQAYLPFSKFELVCAEGDIPTCPTFFPWRKPLDHIFIPSIWKSSDAKTIAFGSDHLAVSVCVDSA